MVEVVTVDMVVETMGVMVDTVVEVDTMVVLRAVVGGHQQEGQVSQTTVLSGQSTTAAWEW